MSQEFDVCIRGDGVVGRSLALLLARQRLRVALCAFAPASTAEPPKAADVRAYALNQASRTLLESLRVWPGEVTPVGAMQGKYRMVADDGEHFDAPIAPFRLAIPGLLH